MSTINAQVSQVPYGTESIEGLLCDLGVFYVSVPQICTQFDVPQKNAVRDLKAIYGDGLAFLKVKVESTRNIVNAVTLPDYEILVSKLDRAGNKLAQDFRDALVGLSLHQLFCDAFELKFDKEDRQRLIGARLLAKAQHKPLVTRNFQQWGATKGRDYAKLTNQLKTAIGLPLVPVDQFNSQQMAAWTVGQVRLSIAADELKKTADAAIEFVGNYDYNLF